MLKCIKETITTIFIFIIFVWTLLIARQITSPNGLIGVELDSNIDKTVFIKDFLQYSPAKESGLEINDIIIKIDDKSMNGKNKYYVASKLSGKANTNVKVLIKRENKEQEFEIKRAKRKIKWFIPFNYFLRSFSHHQHD